MSSSGFTQNCLMRYSAKLLGWVAVTSALIASAIQMPSFSEETRHLRHPAITPMQQARELSPLSLEQAGVLAEPLSPEPFLSEPVVMVPSRSQITTQASERKAEADRLLQQGIQKMEEIEALRQASANLFSILTDEETEFESLEARREYIREQSSIIYSRIGEIRTEIVQNWLRALKIYRDTDVRNLFPLESRQGEQNIVVNLIEIDFEDHWRNEDDSQLFRPQEMRDLIQRALNSYLDPDFRVNFPLESHQGEQNIVAKLINPSRRFPQLIDEEIFGSHELKELIYQAIENGRNPIFRNIFPLGSRQSEYRLLSLISPSNRTPDPKRFLIQPHEKVQLWQQLLTSYRDTDFQRNFPRESLEGEIDILSKIGFIYLFEIDQPERSLEVYEQGLSIAREAGNNLVHLRVLGQINSVYWALEKYQEIISASEQAVEIIKEVKDQIRDNSNPIMNEMLLGLSEAEIQILEEELEKAEARYIYAIGTAYLGLGQPEEAIKYYQESSIVHENCFCFLEARVSMPLNLGVAYWLTGRYEQAAEIYSQLNDSGITYYPFNYAVIFVGRAYEYLAQYQQAIDFHEQAIASESDGFLEQIPVLYNLGRTYTGLGQYQQAIEIYNKALVLATASEASEISDWEGIILADLGRVYLIMGQHERAAGMFEQSLRYLRQIVHEQIVENSRTSFNSFEAGRIITDRVILKHWENSLLSNLGVAHIELEHYPEAISFLEEALTIATDIRDFSGESKALRNLGDIYLKLDQYQQALEYYEQALIIGPRS